MNAKIHEASLPKIALRTLMDENLTELESELRILQVMDIAKQTPIHAAGNIGNGAMLAWVFWDKLPGFAVLGWIGGFALLWALELYRWRKKKNWPAPVTVSRRAGQRIVMSALVSGAIWMLAIATIYPLGTTDQRYLVLFVVGGLGAGSVATLAAHPIACLAFLGLPMLTIQVFLTYLGPTIHAAHVMAPLWALFSAVLMSALLGGFSSFLTIVRTRIESRNFETKLLQLELAESTEANRTKTVFLANMSHELRTPLNAIIGFSEILYDQPAGTLVTDQYRDYAKDILTAGHHLLHIVNNVLDVSRIESGKMRLDEEEATLPVLIDSAVRLVSQLAKDSQVSVNIDLGTKPPKLIADEIRVRQILVNLLSNAIKFTHPGGIVDVGITPASEGGVSIWVRDNGIGMTPAEIAIARQPFSQVENSFTRQRDGAGLGLSLVEGFASLHGATLDIDSTPGKGTLVSVKFPSNRVLWLENGTIPRAAGH